MAMIRTSNGPAEKHDFIDRPQGHAMYCRVSDGAYFYSVVSSDYDSVTYFGPYSSEAACRTVIASRFPI